MKSSSSPSHFFIPLVLLCLFGQPISGFWCNLYTKFIENQSYNCPIANGSYPQFSYEGFNSTDLRVLISTANKSAFEIRLIWLPFMMLEKWKCEPGLAWDSGIVNSLVKIQFWLSLLEAIYRECRCLGPGKRRQNVLERGIFLRHRWTFRERAAHLVNSLYSPRPEKSVR